MLATNECFFSYWRLYGEQRPTIGHQGDLFEEIARIVWMSLHYYLQQTKFYFGITIHFETRENEDDSLRVILHHHQ